MAIRPKKQTSSNRGETGGGAPRGGARSGGISKVTPKPKTTSIKPATAAKVWAAGAAATTGVIGSELLKAYNKSKKR